MERNQVSEIPFFVFLLNSNTYSILVSDIEMGVYECRTDYSFKFVQPG